MFKISVLEPLGLPKNSFLKMAEPILNGKAEITCFDNRDENPEILIERSLNADVVVISNIPFKREVIEKCPSLKMICVAFTGVDHIDLECCRERDIVVSNCSGYATVAVAELVFGMLITLMRNVIPCNIKAKSSGTKDGLVGNELCGKTFGVVGYGQIGRKVADIALAFGLDVLVSKRNNEPLPSGMKQVPLEELLANSDIISLHVPLTNDTKNLIASDKINMMKKDAILVNTSRGLIVDNTALAHALQNKTIGGACIDVLETEPPFPANHPLFNAPNLIITPHIAFASKESMVKRAAIVIENISSWINGEPKNLCI